MLAQKKLKLAMQNGEKGERKKVKDGLLQLVTIPTVFLV